MSNENKDKEYLSIIAKYTEEKLPDNHGYIILTFPFFDENGICSYVSNAERKDVLDVMEAFLLSAGRKTSWMKHIR